MKFFTIIKEKKGSHREVIRMLQLVIIFYILSQIFLRWKIKKAQDRCKYTTACCHDARASMGMFAYKTDVEVTREWLNSPNCKF